MNYENYFNKLTSFYNQCFESSEEHLKCHLIAPLFLDTWGFKAQFNQRYYVNNGRGYILVDLMLGDEIWIETKRIKLEPDIHNATHDPYKRINEFKSDTSIKILIMTNGLRWILHLKHPEGSGIKSIEFSLNPEIESEVNMLFPQMIEIINALKKHSYSIIYDEILEIHQEMLSVDKFNQLLKDNRTEMIKSLVEQFGGSEEYYRIALSEDIC